MVCGRNGTHISSAPPMLPQPSDVTPTARSALFPSMLLLLADTATCRTSQPAASEPESPRTATAPPPPALLSCTATACSDNC